MGQLARNLAAARQADDAGAADERATTATTTLATARLADAGRASDCRVVAADALAEDGCAVTADGHVYCWGDDSQSQLGMPDAADRCAMQIDGAQQLSPCSLAPVQVPGIDEVVDVALVPGEVCALRSDGQVWCWGGKQATPLQVQGIVHATQLAAWGDSCVLEASGVVKCWGAAHVTASVAPITARALQLTGSCALMQDGTVRCWGSNESGMLGTTAMLGRCAGPYNAPCSAAGVPVALAGGNVDVSSGWQHACAVANDSTLWCWGHNVYGQLGRPAAQSPICASGFACEMLPLQVPGLQGVERVYAGTGSTCVRMTDGHARCWGNLGDTQVVSTAWETPREIALPDTVASITHERGSSCFMLTNGALYCLGLRYLRKDGVGVLSPGPTLARVDVCGTQSAGVH